MGANKVIRRLGFSKPARSYYEIKDNTFKYIRKRDYDSVIFLMKAMTNLFKKYKSDDVPNLVKNIILYRFTTYRKFITV